MIYNAYADCNNCALRKYGPVWLDSDIRNGAQYTIILDHPDAQDMERRRCAAGRYAIDMVSGLSKAGIKRSECNILYTVGCCPPGGDLEAAMREYKQGDEAALMKAAKEEFSPIKCCSGRLIHDLQRTIELGTTNIILMGDIAINAFGGRNSSDKMRGSAAERALYPGAPICKVFYTIHPRRIYGERTMRAVFTADLAKARRYFTNSLRWVEPTILIATNEDELAFGFESLRGSKMLSYDVETDGIHPETSSIRCIGFANENVAVVIPIVRMNGMPYRLSDGRAMRDVAMPYIKDACKGVYGNLIGHNAGNFDRRMVEADWGFTPDLKFDTILAHLLVDNELPHRLGFLGSYYTDYTEAWKADNAATESPTDKDLWIYNGKDCIVTTRIAKRLYREMGENGQAPLYEREAMLQDMGSRMSSMGMQVDPGERAKLIAIYTEKRRSAQAVLWSFFGHDFNPKSNPQLKAGLYKKMGFQPPSYSKKTGEPSTNDDAVRKMMITYTMSDDYYNVLHNLRLFKSAQQLIQLNLAPFKPAIQQHFQREGWVDGILDANWVVHPGYNRLPATGRFSSSEPNLQNLNAVMRRMFTARKGNKFVACDAEALEVRVIAEESGAKHTLKVLNAGLDLHNETMEFTYGMDIWQLPGAPKDRRKKGDKDFKSSRNTIKNVRYAHNYAAGIRRIWEQATSAQDNDGNLLYRNLTVDMIEEIVMGLRRLEPEIPAWWESTQSLWKKQGYIADTIWGRKRRFMKKATLPGIVNHPIQAGGFHIIAEAMIEIFYGEKDWFATTRVDRSPLDCRVLQYGPTRGLVTQTHDSMMFEIPEADVPEAIAVLTKVMTRRRKFGGLLDYTCEAKHGYTWESV